MMLAGFATLMTTLALTVSGPAANKWESDYGKALAQTKTDSRPLLVVLDKPGVQAEQVPSKLLNAEDTNAPLAKYDLCHVDVATKYGQAVAKVFNANEFPYVAIIDKSGSVVLHRHAGRVSAEGWNATLAKHQSGNRLQRVTVAKPVIEEASQQVTYGGGYYESTPFSFATPVQPYCPNCQRR